MIRDIRLCYDWLSHHHILTEEIVTRRVREPVAAGMRDPLREGKVFKGVAKGTSAESVQRLLSGEHRLIVVCVKIPSNDEPICRRDFRSDKADEKLTAFLELESVLRAARTLRAPRSGEIKLDKISPNLKTQPHEKATREEHTK
jgi:hypothetical protein